MKTMPRPAVSALRSVRAMLLLLCLSVAVPVQADTFEVTSTADPGDGTCNVAECTLHEAIAAANANPGADVITFQSGLSGTINLMSALPDLSTNVEIQGPGAGVLTVRRDMGAFNQTGDQTGVADPMLGPLADNGGPTLSSLLALGPAVAQTTRYVDADATGGAKDGTSWADAFTTLQDALAVVQSGDEIWVAEGTYYPDASDAGNTDTNDRASTFALKNGVALYGGFSGDGTETEVSQRNPATHVTTLSGDLQQDDGADFQNNADNAYHVVTGDGVDATALLDGFTITAGNADSPLPNNGSPFPEDVGGGLYNENGSPTLTNVTITGNTAFFGGGLYNINGSSPTLLQVNILNNEALGSGLGGGLYNNNSSPTLLQVNILNNEADEGGGLYNENGSNPIIEGSTIAGSSRGRHGGGIYNDNSSPTLTNVTITDNRVTFNGGGLYNENGSSPIIESSTITGNEAGADGGGLYNDGSSPTLTNVTISGNKAFDGGGLSNENGSSPILTNVTITDNRAINPNNGGIFSADGGGLYNVGSNPVITNAILWNNSDQSGTGASAQIFNFNSSPTVSFSIVQGDLSSGTQDGGNNLDQDPLLGPLQDNGGPTPTRLPAKFSPAIDKGSCQSSTVTTDQRGETRPYNADDATYPDASDGCDIGAVELQASEVRVTPTTLFVKHDASGANDGTSWTDAFTRLQDALAAAVIDGDAIWVAAGTYYPDEGTGQTDNDRDATFQLKDGVALYGGFAGTETLLSQRDIAAHVTILSGDIDHDDGGEDAPFEPETDSDSNAGTPSQTDHLRGSNAYNVVTGFNVLSTSVLDGFRITGGMANGSQTIDQRGGGIRTASSSPTLTNNTIEGNTAFGGGGLYSQGGTPTITSSTIHSNTALDNGSGNGGGVRFFESTPTLQNITLANNYADDRGGAIFNATSNPIIEGSTIAGNSASADAGGVYNSASDPTIRNSTITGNMAGASGAAFYNSASSPTITSSTIIDNVAQSSTGGVYNIDDSDPLIKNTILWGNEGAGSNVAKWQLDNRTSDDTPTVSFSIFEGVSSHGFPPATIDGGNNLDADPLLGPLANNGGPTLTHLPQSTSPAVANGQTDLTTDQRGTSRPQGIQDDIGAVERVQSGFTESLVVTTTVDEKNVTSDPSQGTGTSLREAILWANANPGDDVITFQSGLSGTIDLTGVLPDLSTNIEIQGPGADVLTVRRDTGGNYRIFTVFNGFSPGPTVTISGLTITNGFASGAEGGGLRNQFGTVTIENSTVSGNTASSVGGGLYSAGLTATLTLINTTVSGNTASDGGGLHNNFGMVTVERSTVSGNTANFRGGGLYNFGGTVTVEQSTVSGNTVNNGRGGGLSNDGWTNGTQAGATLTLTNSTVSGNTATSSYGGGLFNDFGTVTIASSTITNNTAPANVGGGAASLGNTSSGTEVEVQNTIIAGNTDSDVFFDGENTFVSNGHNLIGDGNATGVFNQTGDQTAVADPQLGPLADNGGPTLTHMIEAAGPADDTGETDLTTDQRGFARPEGIADDIGAVERGGDPPSLTLQLKVFLQGPYDNGSGQMTTALLDGFHLPGSQPFDDPAYDGTPLDYDGSESVGSFPVGTVDWVLIEMRQWDTGAAVARGAAFVLAGGDVVAPGGGPLVLGGTGATSYYLIVRHRNHLSVMSAILVDCSAGTCQYDFRTSQSQAHGEGAMTELEAGAYGLLAADGNASGSVTASDQSTWSGHNGTSGYLAGDYNLSGGATASDAALWSTNNGTSSQVPATNE